MRLPISLLLLLVSVALSVHRLLSCTILQHLILKNIATLKSRLGSHSPCELMHVLYIAEVYSYRSVADMGLSSFSSSHRALEKAI